MKTRRGFLRCLASLVGLPLMPVEKLLAPPTEQPALARKITEQCKAGHMITIPSTMACPGWSIVWPDDRLVDKAIYRIGGEGPKV